MVSMLAYQLFWFCLCRASERSRHSDSKVDEVLILDKRTQYFEIWGSFPAQKLLTQGDNYFSKVCRDLIMEKAHFKLCKYTAVTFLF
jgi:hypothetical protein